MTDHTLGSPELDKAFQDGFIFAAQLISPQSEDVAQRRKKLFKYVKRLVDKLRDIADGKQPFASPGDGEIQDAIVVLKAISRWPEPDLAEDEGVQYRIQILDSTDKGDN